MCAVTGTSWRALGTSVHVLVTDEPLGRAACDAVASVLEAVDATYSRFRSDSELSQVLAHPGSAIRVSPLLAEAIEAALRGARLTDGAVDPTVGRAMRLIGYDADFRTIGWQRGPLTLHTERVPGWQAIWFDPASRMLRLPQGVELDLGSTGKALAADLAAVAAFAALGHGGVLVNLGGDVATAGKPPEGGWRVLAADDAQTAPDTAGEVISLGGGAVATSSTTVRRWTRGAIQLHHIVDPDTGLPARSPWRTVSVVAANCIDANIAATAAIIRGGTAVDWLASLGLPSRLVATTGEITRIGGWPLPASDLTLEIRS